MTDPAAIAIAAKLTIVDQEAYGERTLLWVWDDVSYRVLVSRLQAQRAYPSVTHTDPRRPGLLGIVIKELKNDER